MPKCTRCEDIFSADEGEYNEEKEFVCAMCADAYGDEDLDEEEDEDGADEDDDDADVKPKACPSCKEKSTDYAESGICPECGFEKDE